MAIAFVFPGQGSQAVGMGARAGARPTPPARAGVRRGRCRARAEALRDHVRGADRDPDADRERPAGADGRLDGGHARAGDEQGLHARRQGQVSSPAIRWANIRRLPRPAPSASPTPRACSRLRGRAMQAAVPVGQGRHGGAARRRQGCGREARRGSRAGRGVPARQRQRADPGRHLRRQDRHRPRAPSSPRRTACAASCRSTSARPSIAR